MKVRLDFVTNSSSSCFVISTNKSEDIIIDELTQILELFGSLTGQHYKYEEVFGYPRRGMNLDDYARDGYNVKAEPDDIIVTSQGDNSIPWGIADFIEAVYGARRYHLG